MRQEPVWRLGSVWTEAREDVRQVQSATVTEEVRKA